MPHRRLSWGIADGPLRTWPVIIHISHKYFGCSIDDEVKSFCRCANAILGIDGRSNDMVMLRLLESQCISILAYAIMVVCVAARGER